MLVYKCDGESYSNGKKCVNEINGKLPERWLSIEGKIKNGLPDAHIIQCDGLYHFCSRECLVHFLFKNITSPAGSPALNNMNTNIDPGKKQDEQANEQATEQESAGAAAESAAQDRAMEANENAEEGGSEG